MGGLESFIPHTKAQKYMHRLDATMLVLDEVDRQYNSKYGCIYNPNRIKSLYEQISIECQFEAELRAIQDRNDIQEEKEKFTTENDEGEIFFVAKPKQFDGVET